MYRTIVCLLFVTLAAEAQENNKQFKPGEFDTYASAGKALAANQFQQAVTALDEWKEKYPDSEYEAEREALYVQAYAGLNQPAKTLHAALPLLAKDLGTLFPGPAGQPVILRVLYGAAWAIPRIPNPSPAELSAAEKAARQLLGWDQPLPGVPADKWAEASRDMREKAGAALLYLAMLPGIQAMAKQPPDCAAAESAYTRALAAYPDRSVVAYELARALTCETKASPEKAVQAIYEFQRAAVVDPTLGGARSDPKQVQTYADTLYVKFHGSEDGLLELKKLAKQTPLPPAALTIKSAAELAAERKDAFDAANPQLALWQKISAALSQPDGAEYFETGLKDAGVPQLQGKLVEARPACRPRELVIAVPLPDSPEPLKPEITLKLDKPLAGEPERGQDFHFQAVPVAFTAQPFMLTMTTESANIEGLTLTPCNAVGPGRAGKTRR